MSRSFLASREKVLRARPLVVGTLTGRIPLSSQLSKARTADLIEVRLDTFRDIYKPVDKAVPFARKLLAGIRKKSKKPLLLTLRSPFERGAPVPKREFIGIPERSAIIEAALPLCAMVDLEIRHFHLAERLTARAHRLGVDAIHSYHDFAGPSNDSFLNKLIHFSKKIKGDVLKVAVTPRTNHDLESFLKWGLQVAQPKLVLIGMGKAGLPSRTIGFSFGSILTFGHLGKSTAPGQVPVADLARSIHSIYGN